MKHSRLLVKCKCESEFQDKRYGKGVRLSTPVNKTRQLGKLQSVRCTVCNSQHSSFTGH